MSTISTILSTLRSAVWAIDVRDEIANAIEQCYKDVNSPSLVTDGIEEVIGDMVDNGRISGAIVEDLGLITEGTSNLFDFTTVTAGRLNTSTGEVGEASGYWTSDFILVENGKTYYFANTDRRVAYNSSKAYSANISGTTWTASADGYIRVSVTSANRKTAKINEGSAKDYRPGRSPIDFNLRDDVYRKAEVDAALAAVTIATDPELETAGAAADAKATGDAISVLNESLDDINEGRNTVVEWINGYGISTSGATVNLTPVVSNNFRYAILNTTSGDVWVLTAKGGVNYRAWCFVDANNNVLSAAGSNVACYGTEVIAPNNANRIILNDSSNTLVSSYKKNKITSRLDSLEEHMNSQLNDFDGGIRSVEFAPSVLIDEYIAGANGTIATSSGTCTMYVPCEANTKYIVEKTAGSRFVVGCTDSVPAHDVTCTNFVVNHDGSRITLLTTAQSKYLAIWYWRSQDSITEAAMRASVSIKREYSDISIQDTKDLVANQMGFYEIAPITTKTTFYISSVDNQIKSQQNTASIYFSCEENTTYRITKQAGGIFRVAYTDAIPEVGLTVSELVVDDTGTSLDIKTSPTAGYVIVYYYFETQDTASELTLRESISVSKKMPFAGAEVIEDLTEKVSTLNDIIGRQTSQYGQSAIYVVSLLDATSREARYPAVKELMDIAMAVESDPTGDYSSMFTQATKGVVCKLPVYNTEMYAGYNYNVLFAANADTQSIPASITKVMSLITGMDYVSSLLDRVTVESSDISTGSGSTYNEGDILTIEDILFAMMQESSNTLSNVFAKYCGKKMLNNESATASESVNKFVSMMNSKASEIGMLNSTFTSPHGQPTSCLTTARDMLKCTINACRHPWILRSWRHRGAVTIHVYGTNERDIVMPGQPSNIIGNDYFVHGGKLGGLGGEAAASAVMIVSKI